MATVQELLKLSKPSFGSRVASAGSRIAANLRGEKPEPEDTTIRDLLIKQQLANMGTEGKLQATLDTEARKLESDIAAENRKEEFAIAKSIRDEESKRRLAEATALAKGTTPGKTKVTTQAQVPIPAFLGGTPLNAPPGTPSITAPQEVGTNVGVAPGQPAIPLRRLVPEDSILEEAVEGGEQRRLGREARLGRADLRTSLKFSGAKGLDQEDIDIYKEDNIDVNSMIDSGRAIRRSDGRVDILDDANYQRMIAEGKLTPGEQEQITDTVTEANAWGRVVKKFQDIGVTEGEVFDVEFEETDDPFLRELGIFSIPARFKIARQFRDDPRLEGISRDIELAFQAFRKRVTGVQAGERELKYLREIMPSLTDQPKVFFNVIRNFMSRANEDLNVLLNTKEATGRNVDQFRNLLEKAPSISQVGLERGSPNIPGTEQEPLQIFSIEKVGE